jgi:hypothetical protein
LCNPLAADPRSPSAPPPFYPAGSRGPVTFEGGGVGEVERGWFRSGGVGPKTRWPTSSLSLLNLGRIFIISSSHPPLDRTHRVSRNHPCCLSRRRSRHCQLCKQNFIRVEVVTDSATTDVLVSICNSSHEHASWPQLYSQNSRPGSDPMPPGRQSSQMFKLPYLWARTCSSRFGAGDVHTAPPYLA